MSKSEEIISFFADFDFCPKVVYLGIGSLLVFGFSGMVAVAASLQASTKLQ